MDEETNKLLKEILNELKINNAYYAYQNNIEREVFIEEDDTLN